MNQMTNSTQAPPAVISVGVDTHQLTHHAGLLDAAGRELGDREFPATQAGYEDLVAWATSHGQALVFGVESTGTYGAGLAAHLMGAGFEVHEVARPDKTTRAMQGKSDPIDAYAAARAVRAGRAAGWVKAKGGAVEAMRVIKVARDSAVKDRTAAISQLRDVITTAPEALRAELLGLSAAKRVAKALGYRPDPARVVDPTQAVKLTLRALARRISALSEEITEADKILDALVREHLPSLVGLPQVGTQIAAQLAITAGQNIDRMRSEAAFAKLTGVAPVPASSGKTRRMRLNRGGDRQANSALYMVVVGRLRNHPETLAYRTRRETEGLSKKDIIRCLKRYVARETYNALKTDLTTT
jgi:transposase